MDSQKLTPMENRIILLESMNLISFLNNEDGKSLSAYISKNVEDALVQIKRILRANQFPIIRQDQTLTAATIVESGKGIFDFNKYWVKFRSETEKFSKYRKFLLMMLSLGYIDFEYEVNPDNYIEVYANRILKQAQATGKVDLSHYQAAQKYLETLKPQIKNGTIASADIIEKELKKILNV